MLETDLDAIAHDAVRQGMARLRMSGKVRIVWKNYPATAGVAHCGSDVICLSKRLLDTPAKVRDTALHELAHIYVFRVYGSKARGHGREWRKTMERLGLKPNIYHDYPCERRKLAPKFYLLCESCRLEIPRVRPLKENTNYFHPGCGGRFVIRT